MSKYSIRMQLLQELQTMATRDAVLESIKQFFWVKCTGSNHYTQELDNSTIQFNTSDYSIQGFDPILGFVNEITIGYSLAFESHVCFKISNIPFKPEEEFLNQLTTYVIGLEDCYYDQPIEYSDLVLEFASISNEFEETYIQDSYQYPLDNYNAIMAILELPEPPTEEDYLPLVSNPYAGQTEEKDWYGRQDPKRSFARVQRAKWKRQARKLKNTLFSPAPDFDVMDTIEFDDCSYS